MALGSIWRVENYAAGLEPTCAHLHVQFVQHGQKVSPLGNLQGGWVYDPATRKRNEGAQSTCGGGQREEVAPGRYPGSALTHTLRFRLGSLSVILLQGGLPLPRPCQGEHFAVGKHQWCEPLRPRGGSGVGVEVVWVQNCPVVCRQAKVWLNRGSSGCPFGYRTVSKKASIAMAPVVGDGGAKIPDGSGGVTTTGV